MARRGGGGIQGLSRGASFCVLNGLYRGLCVTVPLPDDLTCIYQDSVKIKGK